MDERGPNYLPPVPLGTPMICTIIGRAVASYSARFASGDLVTGLGHWADYLATSEQSIHKVRRAPGLPLTAALGVSASMIRPARIVDLSVRARHRPYVWGGRREVKEESKAGQ